jgi:hypothetical protein
VITRGTGGRIWGGGRRMKSQRGMAQALSVLGCCRIGPIPSHETPSRAFNHSLATAQEPGNDPCITTRTCCHVNKSLANPVPDGSFVVVPDHDIPSRFLPAGLVIHSAFTGGPYFRLGILSFWVSFGSSICICPLLRWLCKSPLEFLSALRRRLFTRFWNAC